MGDLISFEKYKMVKFYEGVRIHVLTSPDTDLFQIGHNLDKLFTREEALEFLDKKIKFFKNTKEESWLDGRTNRNGKT